MSKRGQKRRHFRNKKSPKIEFYCQKGAQKMIIQSFLIFEKNIFWKKI